MRFSFFAKSNGFISSLVVLLLSLSTNVQAANTIDEQLIGMRAICAELKTHYGMLQYKESQNGVALDAICAKYERLIREAKTLEEEEGLDAPNPTRKILPVDEYRQLLIGLGAEFKDGHLNVLRNSANVSTIGLRTIPIDGKLTIVGFDPTFYSTNLSNPKLRVGDEIVTVDGHPVAELARRNMLYMQSGTYQSRWERAMSSVLNVGRALRQKKKSAPVNIRFRRGDQEWEAEFRWSNTSDFNDLKLMARVLDPNHQLHEKAVPYYYGSSGRPETYFRKGLEELFDSHEIIDLGKLINLEIEEGKKAKLPQFEKLSKISRIPVYIVRHKGKSVGVIRIPDYSPEDQVAELQWMAMAIKRLEASTDTLIIDHLSNNGGSNFESTQFIRFFADKKAIPGFQANIRMSETFLQTDTPWLLQDVDSEEIDHEEQNFAQLELARTSVIERLRREFEAGKRWTGASSWYTTTVEMMANEFGRITGREDTLYTKPVTLLNDRRSASNGDMVPAILQAAGRVQVVGERSAGLGGSVYRNTPSMPVSEMYMRCTMAVCFRFDNLPIEGIGTIPDVLRDITRRDLAQGFKEYAEDALESAVLHAEGVPSSEISSRLPSVIRENSELHTTRKPKYYDLYQKKLAELRDAIKGIEDPVALTQTYQRFTKELAAIDIHDFHAIHWRHLFIPLPDLLIRQDIFLASLQRKGEVIERLHEMKQVPRYAKNPQVVALIAMLHHFVASLESPHFAHPCEAYLSPKAFFQQLEDDSTAKP